MQITAKVNCRLLSLYLYISVKRAFSFLTVSVLCKLSLRTVQCRYSDVADYIVDSSVDSHVRDL